MAKSTIKQTVLLHSAILREMTSHTQLREWAIANGMDNRSAFPKFKLALLNIGINYEEMKGIVIEQQTEELESKITHEVTLYVDAKCSAGKFGICDSNGEVLWYGRFFDGEDADEQSKAELCAAKKAVWLALKIREANCLPALRLNLYVDAQWLTYQSHGGQKGYILSKDASKYQLQLNVEWIRGTRNPADKWTTEQGYKKWSENNLQTLISPLQK